MTCTFTSKSCRAIPASCPQRQRRGPHPAPCLGLRLSRVPLPSRHRRRHLCEANTALESCTGVTISVSAMIAVPRLESLSVSVSESEGCRYV